MCDSLSCKVENFLLEQPNKTWYLWPECYFSDSLKRSTAREVHFAFVELVCVTWEAPKRPVRSLVNRKSHCSFVVDSVSSYTVKYIIWSFRVQATHALIIFITQPSRSYFIISTAIYNNILANYNDVRKALDHLHWLYRTGSCLQRTSGWCH